MRDRIISRKSAIIGGVAIAICASCVGGAYAATSTKQAADAASKADVAQVASAFNAGDKAKLDAAVVQLKIDLNASLAATAATSTTVVPTTSTTVTANAQSAGDLTAIAKKATNGSLTLASGSFTFSNFNPVYGVSFPTALTTFTGAGVDKTKISMTANSSTHKADAPTGAGTVNQLALLEFNGGKPNISGFTLTGTTQGHLYHGLRIHNTDGALVHDVKVEGIAGNSNVNPGESMGLLTNRDTNITFNNVEIDGKGVGASGLGINNDTGVTINGGSTHDNPFSAGVAFYQSSNLTVKDINTYNNKTGLNFERTGGTTTINNAVFTNNKMPIHIANDQASTKFIINDPKFTGTKLLIQIQPVYMGNPNKQKTSDIHVFVNGVDKTAELVTFV